MKLLAHEKLGPEKPGVRVLAFALLFCACAPSIDGGTGRYLLIT